MRNEQYIQSQSLQFFINKFVYPARVQSKVKKPLVYEPTADMFMTLSDI